MLTLDDAPQSGPEEEPLHQSIFTGTQEERISIDDSPGTAQGFTA
jgi:hypothetical protein